MASHDPDFDFMFVTLVQSFPSLWDTSTAEYWDADQQESAWQELAADIGDGYTVAQCKSTWTTMRDAFTKYRHELVEGTNPEKYPLADSMEFLVPFMKVENGDAEVKTEPSVVGNGESSDPGAGHMGRVAIAAAAALQSGSTIVTNVVDESCTHNVTVTVADRPLSAMQDPTSSSSYADEDYTMEDDSNSCSHMAVNAKDGDALFLLSLLPDMKQMNDQQKSKFKAKLLTLSGNILTAKPGPSVLRAALDT
ncbi:hypothetical protein pipiens_018293 [Culex pipiens pipiens]|uniref:MADF domain-containing protein n=1 Tax=Culex pipiens pipiens TaxID=38569 RepID=A0ABD1CCJ4_CULPP